MAEEYIITLKHAELIRISDTAKDPFCKVRYSHQEYKTKICKGVPKVPIWNETFRLKKVKMIDTIVIEVYDMESPIKNELLGSGIFSLNTLKFKKNVHTYQEIALKVGKADKIMGKVFFEIEYTREGIESEQEKEHKVLKGSEKKEPEEEKQEEKPPTPPKPKREVIKFELPKKDKKINAPIKLLGEEFSKEVEDFNISIINKFNQQTLSDFFLEENVRKAVIAGLHELGRIKPKNPTKFLGEFFINYK